MPSSTPDGFAPLDALGRALRWWWVILLCAVLGGGAGMVVSALRPPVYEAVGTLSASIDFVRTGPLTQYEEDVALNAIGDLAQSAPVLEAVAGQAQAEGMAITAVDVRRMAVVERKLTTWDIRVRHTDAQVAERVAVIWLEAAQAQIEDGYRHALLADGYQQAMQRLERCLGEAGAVEPSTPLCSQSRFAEIQADLQAAGAALAQERAASRGIFSGLVIGAPVPAALRPGPVQSARGGLVLAGCLIGWVVGIWLAQTELIQRWGKRV